MTKALLALTAGIAISTTANAASYGGVDFAFQPYIGAKAGAIVMPDDLLDADPTGAIGIVAGYEIDANFGTEVEYVSSVVDADYVGGEYDINTMGVYATYRYNFPENNVYAKAKIGYSKTNFDGGKLSSKDDDSGSVAGGVAVGMHLSPELSVEGEYSLLPSDATEMFDANSMTVGVRMKF